MKCCMSTENVDNETGANDPSDLHPTVTAKKSRKN